VPALLKYDPTGATFSPVTPAQYAMLVAALKADEHVSNFYESNNGGSCRVQGVDLGWGFDGTSNLHVAITGKHGLIVSRVPNATIFDHLRDEFNKHLGG
jgi:hypothetical protein